MVRHWIAKNKRRMLAISLLVSLFVLVLVGAGLLPIKGDITRQDYDEIRLGMTLLEVQTILGSQGMNASSVTNDMIFDRQVIDMAAEGPQFDDPGRVHFWFGRDHRVMVRLGEDNRVTNKILNVLTPHTFFERIRYLARI